MTELSRRTVLTGAAVATAASALPPLAAAAPAKSPAALGTQNAGWYRYRLGDFEVTVVTDGVNRMKFPDTFVVNKTRDEVNAGLAATFLQPAPDMIAVPFSPIVVNTGSRLVVIDTGLGLGMHAKSKGAVGQFQNNLKAAGIEAGQVDAVIVSHFHGDHINGLLDAEGKPAFPNAEVLVPAPEWAFWSDESNAGKAPPAAKANFGNVKRVFGPLGGKVTQYEAGKEVVPGITAVATHGHTPGHMSHVVASGSASVFVQADVTNIPLFVRNPDWHVMFDMDAQAAEATRRKVYDMLATDKVRVQGFHYPFPSLAYVEKSGNGYRETYVPWSPTI